MPITVKEAMGIGGLARCRVVAGREGLSREIEHITVMEVPDVVQWLKGRELLLTSLFSVKDDEQAMFSLVSRLHHRGSSALAIKTSHYVERIPDSILRQGDELDFPIIEVLADVSYLDIMTPLMNKIFSSTHNLHGDMESFFRWLTELAMGGKGIQAMLDAIEKFTGNVVTVETETALFEDIQQQRGIAPLTSAQKKEIQLSKRSIRMNRSWQQRQIPCLVTPLILNEDVHGYVTYWHMNSEFQERDLLLLERSVPLMALEFLKVKTRLDVEQSYKDDFLLDILSGNPVDRYQLEDKAGRFGWELQQDYQVFLVHMDEDNPYAEEKGELLLPSQEVLRRALNRIRLYFSFQRIRVILGLVRGHVVLLYPATELKGRSDDESRSLLEGICQGLKQELRQMFDRTFSVGFGRQYKGVPGIAQGYKEALSAVQLGVSIYGSDFCCHFHDLKLYRLLAQVKDKEELVAVYHETIGKLVLQDEQHQTKLTQTLRAFFECNGSLVDTSQKLFVHVNTMKYRLQKVEQITGCNVNHSEDRLWLQIGLKIQDLLFLPHEQSL